jgi:DtxR family transcriptional regulator, Mn-dependent transcriptional regulator
VSTAIQIEEATAASVSPAMQDYLKAVYRLHSAGGPVTTQRLAEELGVSGPSVTNMVKRLAELGLLRHEPYRGAELTPAGTRIALEVVRHHRLLELYLVSSLGYGWDEAHAEADRLEHHISEDLEARLDAALGHPQTDPHGHPIPAADGTIVTLAAVPLSELPVDRRAVVRRVADGDPARLRYLAELGLVPGASVTVVERLPFEGPLRVIVGETERLVGLPLAGAVDVAAA